MLQSYKLRLSDGTVLVVDHDGLGTWLVDDKAMVQPAGSPQWRPLRQYLALERAAERRASRPKAGAPEALPLVYPEGHPKADASIAAKAPDPRESPPIGEPAGLLTLADDPGVPSPSAHSRSRSGAPDELLALAQVSPGPAEAEARKEPAVSPRAIEATVPPPVLAPTSLLVLADDVSGSDAARSSQETRPDPGPAVIRLKPLDEPDEAREDEDPVPAGGEVFDDTPRHDVLDERTLRVIARLGDFLGPWLERLDRLFSRLHARWAAGSASRTDPAPSGVALSAGGPVSGPPASRLLRDRAVAWVHGLGAWVDRLSRAHRSVPSSAPHGPRAPAASGADSPAPPAPLMAPPPISELPIVRLARVEEPEEPGTLYADVGPARTGWLWAKRIVMVAFVVAGGFLGAVTWDAWWPKAAQVGRVVFTEVDQRTRGRDETERRARALREATERLPHLAPETIQLLLSDRPAGALDPPEVFRLASVLADHGLSALSAGERRDLATLQRQLLDTLAPAERARAREYDRARAHRVLLDFENRDALEQLARGARALPPESRERLQALSGKAIAAGLLESRR